ncbi:MAG TPA: M14 family metallopeptidase [Acidobacteriota bacterium]|nr:M14 family metallopeptidase [Acidobacteriota bacterium]
MIARCLIALALLTAVTLAAPRTLAGDVNLSFEHWYDGPAVEKALNDLRNAYPGLCQLQSIGQSEEGRDIWLMTITNTKTGKDTDKPGVYVDGTIHGNEIQATEVCLYLAARLLNGYDDIPMIRNLVDSCTFYIVPVVNVDSRWRFFTDASGFNIGRSPRVPYDDDNDGLADEDDYDDLDGDGEILRMRIRDPFGDWKTHPDDPRVMVRVEPPLRGEWRMLGSEGIDNDGDGQINEDTPGYLDMNRNYPFKWQPEYVQGGAGRFPTCAKVTKAITDFVASRPNICFNYAFHNSGGMILRGPGSKLAGLYSPKDIEVYDFLGQEGEKIVPGYEYLVSMDDLYTTHGDFDEFMFSNLGIYGFVGELFRSEEEQYRVPDEDEEEEEDDSWFGGTRDEEKQKFNDFVNQGTMFREWKKFNHPQFGEIEIGGWRKFTTRIPPTFLLPEMVHRNASHVMFIAGHVPSIDLDVFEVKDLGGGLHRIRARVFNNNAIPTLSAKNLSKGMTRKDILRIEGSGIEVVSGGVVDDALYDRISPVEHRPWMIFTSVPSFGKREVQWIVRGSGAAKITFESLKATNRSRTIQL